MKACADKRNAGLKSHALRACSSLVLIASLAAAPLNMASAAQPGWVAAQAACSTLQFTAAGGPAPTGDVFTLRYAGSSNYEFAYKGTVILFDAQYARVAPERPLGVTQQDLKRVNAIYIGHGHSDHMSEAPFIAEQANAPMYGAWPATTAATKMGLPDALNKTVKDGDIQKYPGFTIQAVLGHHSVRTQEFAKGGQKALQEMKTVTGTMESPDYLAQYRSTVHGSSDPAIQDQGTIAWLVTFDNGYKMVMLDSSGPVTEPERAMMAKVGHIDLASVAYQGFFVAARQIEATLPLVELFKPDVFIPNHHDETAGGEPDMAMYPLFMAIRDKLPGTTNISPNYRTPICVDTRTKDVFVGETSTWPKAKLEALTSGQH